MTFYLGTHEPSWLARAGVPLFVSARRLRRCVALPRAAAPWALDSGGFSEIALHGRWVTPAMQYASEVRRWRDRVGRMAWAAPQDWMCEPRMVQKTGLSVGEHQRLTVHSYRLLGRLAPDLPWIPVLQGYTLEDYLGCVRLYEDAGVCLPVEPVVGLGSVCRRQGTAEAEAVVRELASLGLRLHLFGFKLRGLARVGHLAESSDSMAWSFRARRDAPMPGHAHKSCANCLDYALSWRRRALASGLAAGRTVPRVPDLPGQSLLFEEVT